MATSDNTSTENMNTSSPTTGGGMPFGNPLAPAEGYEYDFSSFNGDSQTPGTPFDPLIGLPGIDNLGDIFGNMNPEDNPFGGGGSQSGSGGGNPFGGGGSQGGFGSGMDDMDEDSEMPVDDMTPMPVEPDGGIGDGAGPIGGNPFGGGNSQGGFGRGSGNSNPFGSGNIDTGEDNENSGSGNSAFGDANSTSGNGNTSFGDNNQTEGNGNRFFGAGGEGFNELFEGRENPLEMSAGGSDVPIDLGSIGGNNPVFAGGGTPAPAGGLPVDLEDLEESSNNQTDGNGNWNFGSNNQTDGNGNWNFGSDNTIGGNGNWNLGDNNDITGSGNRPSGSGNTINGNGNQPTGSGNSITGNRVSTSEDNVNIYGNGDRYFQTDSDGNTTLISDESASDPNYTFDFSGLEGSDSAYTNTSNLDLSGAMAQFSTPVTTEDVSDSSDTSDVDDDDRDIEQSSTESATNEGSEESEVDEVADSDFSDMIEQSESGSDTPINEDDTESDMSEGESDLLEQLRRSPFGRLLDIEGVNGIEDIFGNVGGGSGGGFGGGSGGGFGGGSGGGSGGGMGNGNPFANWNPVTDGNPFTQGDEPDTESTSGGSNLPNETESDSDATTSTTESLNEQVSSTINGFVDSVKTTMNDFIDSVAETSGQPGVIADIGEQYLVRDGEGGFYISADDTFDSDDLLIFGGGIGNQPNIGSLDNFINAMAERSSQPDVIANIGEEYLVRDGEGGWFISADETFDSNDLQVFSDRSGIGLNFSNFEDFNIL